ncbi:MAG TPA: pyrroline-5-carboxylate reductase [Geminicoccaceae bacterium]|nr:pyrroline-5-carboxylate reductase [Geminicoccaceae bacterium]
MAALAGPLLLVGCGKMGGALLRGWLSRGLPPRDVVVVEPDAASRERVREEAGVIAVAESKSLPGDLQPRALVFAIKPQAMAAVLPAYATLAASGAVVLSIAAGTSIARFEAAFGERTPVVRAMPNTPAAIGQGVTALFANPHVSAAQRQLCSDLMAAVGTVHWIDDEAQMHAITAMSGGGPAYVFLLIETLARAGIASGLPEHLAWPLARGTVAGSGALAAQSEERVEVLRQNVTSPGGTTEAALAVLMADDGIQPLFDRAIAAATRRSHELA